MFLIRYNRYSLDNKYEWLYKSVEQSFLRFKIIYWKIAVKISNLVIVLIIIIKIVKVLKVTVPRGSGFTFQYLHTMS